MIKDKFTISLYRVIIKKLEFDDTNQFFSINEEYEMNEDVLNIIANFKKINEIEAILLAGSAINKTEDSLSDYDFYIYTTCEIPLIKRQEAMNDFVEYMEYENEFWETEDDGRLKNGREIEFIYRSYKWIKEAIESKLIKHYADVGYTTCFWANLLSSKILFDRNGRLTKLKQSIDVKYPQELKLNIIRKNYPLLRDQIPAYYFQIKKAVARQDLISINHRTAAFLASYFDILFAINEIPHPGEKKIIKILKENAFLLPENFESNIKKLLKLAGEADEKILSQLDEIVSELDRILISANLKFEQ